MPSAPAGAPERSHLGLIVNGLRETLLWLRAAVGIRLASRLEKGRSGMRLERRARPGPDEHGWSGMETPVHALALWWDSAEAD